MWGGICFRPTFLHFLKTITITSFCTLCERKAISVIFLKTGTMHRTKLILKTLKYSKISKEEKDQKFPKGTRTRPLDPPHEDGGPKHVQPPLTLNTASYAYASEDSYYRMTLLEKVYDWRGSYENRWHVGIIDQVIKCDVYGEMFKVHTFRNP